METEKPLTSILLNHADDCARASQEALTSQRDSSPSISVCNVTLVSTDGLLFEFLTDKPSRASDTGASILLVEPVQIVPNADGEDEHLSRGVSDREVLPGA